MCFLSWKRLLGCIANTKNIQNLLLLHSSWGLWVIPGDAPDIFWVEKCVPMHSSKDVYPAIILLTFQCTVSKNCHTHHSNLVVFTARMFFCVCDHSWTSRFAFHWFARDTDTDATMNIIEAKTAYAPLGLFCLFLDVHIFLLQWCLLQQLYLTLSQNSLNNFCDRVNFF